MLTTTQTIYTSIFIYVIPLCVMIFHSIILGVIWFLLNGLLGAGIGWGMIFLGNTNTTLMKILGWTKPPIIALLLYFLLIVLSK